MTQAKSFIFGVESLAFIDANYNVYAVNDPGKAILDLSYEESTHRGGALNDVRDVAIHSRKAELSISTGYCDAELMKLLTGGTITSLGTSAASIVTGSANGVNTLSGSSATICTGITTISIVSPTLLKTPTDYYITADDFAKVTVTRVFDGKQFPQVTLTASATGKVLDSEYGIQFSTGAGAVSLTAGEKAYVSARSAINTINQKITFDNSIPEDVALLATYRHNGFVRTLKVPVVQPKGSMQGQSATEYQIQDLKMTLQWSSSLGELADIALVG